MSISGYHIAEAGANPISQLAFTLSNGFTSSRLPGARHEHRRLRAQPELLLQQRHGPRIHRDRPRRPPHLGGGDEGKRYGANERSQKLKYHIQTSGRSLHAQEMDFNDIRTTLQALIAIYDNCNSLHTNAYDEAITTPTEESVRRAMAIQLIINREWGLAKNENPTRTRRPKVAEPSCSRPSSTTPTCSRCWSMRCATARWGRSPGAVHKVGGQYRRSM